MHDRYRTIAGDAFTVEYGSGYDVVLVTNFLHHFDAPTNTKMLTKVHAALKPRGRVAVLEFVPNPIACRRRCRPCPYQKLHQP